MVISGLFMDSEGKGFKYIQRWCYYTKSNITKDRMTLINNLNDNQKNYFDQCLEKDGEVVIAVMQGVVDVFNIYQFASIMMAEALYYRPNEEYISDNVRNVYNEAKSVIRVVLNSYGERYE